MNKILITGVAGFIGYHLAKYLLSDEYEIIGIDNLNTYYDIQLKLDRLADLGIDTRGPDFVQQEMCSNQTGSLRFFQLDLCNDEGLNQLFAQEHFDIVVNLAAQAGVRYSLKNPKAYINSNMVGFANLLEACRENSIKHLIYASSSSVYGNQEKIPFSESDPVDHPVSLYAATKKSNELMAYTYHHLYQIPVTGLRFFTVYGPWGRPDMAPFLFTQSILNQEPLKVFNHGNLKRDFTYIDDIIKGIVGVINLEVDKSHHEIFNIGNNKPEKLSRFIELLENHLNQTSIKQMYPMQEGDVYQTFADIKKLQKVTGYEPHTSLEAGLKKFVEWYISYYKKKRGKHKRCQIEEVLNQYLLFFTKKNEN